MNELLPAQRLHPWSWVFYAARALRELALPLLLFLFLRRDDDIGTLIGTAGAALFIVGWGIFKSRSFRFELLADEIVIREGLLVRETRHVPFSRIQSVSEQRGLLHRLLGVTELVLESGSGGKPEAVMRVLDPAAAAHIGGLLRQQRAAESARSAESAAAAVVAADAAADAATGAAAARVLLKLPTDELITLGVISNRGLVVIALLIGAVSQNAELLQRLPGLDRLPAALDAQAAGAAGASPATLLAGLLVLLLSALLLIRVLSVLHALFTQHDFTLERAGDRLRVRRGLLTRVDVSGRVSAIQRLVLEQTLLHRLFRRCRLQVDLASQSAHTAGIVPQLNQLAPIATLPQARALLQECVPGLDLDALDWRPLHRSAALRRWQQSLLWVLPVSSAIAVGMLFLPPPGSFGAATWMAAALPFVLLLAASGWHARRWARTAAFAAGCGVLAWRSGVGTRRWVVVYERRAQATVLRRSPRDRREGTAGFCIDAQGTLLSRALHVPYVDEGSAKALQLRIRDACKMPAAGRHNLPQPSTEPAT